MNEANNIQYGFKRLTSQNWRQPDVPTIFSNVTPDIWINANLADQLNESVPEKIREMFEVARGAMIYGWYFYPLMTLGAEQCFRVLESAVRYCCEKHNIPTKTKEGKEFDTTYSRNISELINAGIIPKDDEKRWEFARSLRNSTSHPASQMILAPGDILLMLKITSERINALFT